MKLYKKMSEQDNYFEPVTAEELAQIIEPVILRFADDQWIPMDYIIEAIDLYGLTIQDNPV